METERIKFILDQGSGLTLSEILQNTSTEYRSPERERYETVRYKLCQKWNSF